VEGRGGGEGEEDGYRFGECACPPSVWKCTTGLLCSTSVTELLEGELELCFVLLCFQYSHFPSLEIYRTHQEFPFDINQWVFYQTSIFSVLRKGHVHLLPSLQTCSWLATCSPTWTTNHIIHFNRTARDEWLGSRDDRDNFSHSFRTELPSRNAIQLKYVILRFSVAGLKNKITVKISFEYFTESNISKHMQLLVR
jgi:hypothetical protein